MGIACSLIVWGARIPRGDVLFLLAGLIVGAIVFLVWLVRVLILLASRLRGSRNIGLAQAHRARWCSVPLSFAMLLLVVWLGAPFAVSFRMSRPAMERVVGEVGADHDSKRRVWVGVYPISRVRLIPGGVELTSAGTVFPWGERGFYYSNAGASLEDGHYYSQQRIDDHWFAWHHGGW